MVTAPLICVATHALANGIGDEGATAPMRNSTLQRLIFWSECCCDAGVRVMCSI
jgi:hypothetical protein